LLHPKELLGGFGFHFLIMSLSMVVLLDHIARSHCRQAAAAADVAALPLLHRCAAITAKLLLLQLPPRFLLRCRCASASTAAALPPSCRRRRRRRCLDSFSSSLLLSLLPFPSPLALMLLVDC
jgi:hypothetical protein